MADCLPPPVRRVVLAALILAGLSSCGDEGASALRSLAERGYSLSISEYHRAAAAGDVSALREFLQSGTAVDVRDAKGETALIAAIRAGKADAAAWLVQNGASLDSLSAEGQSTVFLAAANGHEEVLAALLDAGARIPPAEKGAQTALELAAARGHSRVTALLAARERSSLDVALVAAAGHGDVATLDILLQQGASPFFQDTSGNTALHVAAQAGHGDAVKLLLASGAWRFATNHAGRIALELASNSESSKPLAADPTPEELELDAAPADVPVPPGPSAAGSLKEVPSAIPLTQEAAGLHLLHRLPSIHGAVVDHRLTSSGFPAKPDERLQLRTVRPRQLPMLLDSATEAEAVLRPLMQKGGSLINVTPGATVGDTGLILERVELQPAPDATLPRSWFPRATLREAAGARRFAAHPRLPIRAGELTSVVFVPNTDEIFEARVGNVFRFAGEEDSEARVTAIAPNRLTFDQGGKTWELRL